MMAAHGEAERRKHRREFLVMIILWVILLFVGSASGFVETAINQRACYFLRMTHQHDNFFFFDSTRRRWITSVPVVASTLFSSISPAHSVQETASRNGLKQVTDSNTYSALVYTPPAAKASSTPPPPLLIVIHGAGKNEGDIWSLADIQGEHAGLVPSLIASGKAPKALVDNFAVVAPYSQGKRSFYQEPRQKFLQFIDWVGSDAGRRAGCPQFDPNRVWLFGFSDGATEVVELLTTGRFRGGIVAAYGFTGTLPERAVDKLKDIPMWVFHCADDVIFPVQCSDRLVATLRKNNSNKDLVRYSRFDQDQEGFTGSVSGHSTGITASRSGEVYEWMWSL